MKQKLLCTAISAALLGGSATVMAQLEEVLVTAQKREQSANDIGMAITALSGDALRELGVYDTTDLALVTPGMTFADTGLSTPVYTLRGVGFNEESVQAQATVGVYNDQIAVPFPIMTKGLLMDVQRVEVMKGPQGTLFGRNSTGGAINYIANKPTDEFEASVTGGYGRFETADLAGTISGPLSDNVRGRITARTLQSGEGWQKSVSRGDDLGEMDKAAARMLLDITLSDSADLLVAASWWQDKSDTAAPQFLQPNYQGLFGNANPIAEGLLDSTDHSRISSKGDDDNRDADWWAGRNRLGTPELDMNAHTFSATLNWDINDSVKLTSLSSYSKFESDSSYNMDGFGGMPLDNSYGGLTAQQTISEIVRDQYDDLGILGASGFTNDSDIESWSQELRFSGEYQDLTWILGAYYSDDQVDSTTTQVVDLSTNTNIAFFPLPGNIGLQDVVNLSQQDGTVWAVFGHTEWSFTEDLKLTLGLRYTEDDKDFEGCTADNGNGDASQYINVLVGVNTGGAIDPGLEPGDCVTFQPGTFTGGIIKKNLDEDSTSGKVALDWHVNEDVLTYVSYSRGYKSGSFPTLSTNVDTQFDPVVQEKVDAYEIGMKASLADGTAQLNAAAYYYDYSDKQLLSKTPTIFGALGALANVPEATVYGAEFDLQWQPTAGLYVSMGASYTDTNIDEYVGYNQFGVQGDMEDSEFPLTPEFQANALVNYEWGMGNGMTAFVGADASYSDGFNADYSIKSVVNDGSSGSYDGLLAGLGLEAGDSYGVQDVFDLDDALIIGARIGLRAEDDSWSVTAWGRNLTDEFQPVNSRKVTDGVIRWTGMPTTYGITASYNWN